MATKKASLPHYYTIYQVDDAYRTQQARSYIEATESLEDAAQQGAIPVAIYDVFDWRTDWKLSAPHKRETHEAAVLNLTDVLQLKHE